MQTDIKNDRILRMRDLLINAEKLHTPIEPLRLQFPELSIEEAYEVQLAVVEYKTQKLGHKIIGKKVGLTSKILQQQLNVHEPDYGHLFDYMQLKNKAKFDVSSMHAPMIEGEIAFVLNKPLKGPNVTPSDVINATDYICGAFEIGDSRIKNWDIKIQDTIADNASSSFFLLGDEKIKLDSVDLENESMEIYKNEELVAIGKSDAVLGNPINSVALLANIMCNYSGQLNAGDIILSGSLSNAFPFKISDHFRAHFSTLGDIEIYFTDY